jgi:dTDP-4-dehydrorhamnose 3,5-epimerase
MIIEETKIKGCYVIEPQVFKDKRGYFFESYNMKVFNEKIGGDISFVQDNESFSKRGVLRGLHFQIGEFAQAKLVRAIKGEVLDVVVDIRKNSPTFGDHASFLLTQDNKKQIFVPRGLAHGFIVLSDIAIFSYKCDNFYNKASEGGILYSDKGLNIDWKLPMDQIMVSDKDKKLPNFENAKI